MGKHVEMVLDRDQHKITWQTKASGGKNVQTVSAGLSVDNIADKGERG